MGFVGNVSLLAAAKEFCKSIKNWQKSKPGVEFQYGGRLFTATGSSIISAGCAILKSRLIGPGHQA